MLNTAKELVRDFVSEASATASRFWNKIQGVYHVSSRDGQADASSSEVNENSKDRQVH